MKRKIAFTVLSAAIVLGSASAVLAGPTQSWEDIAKAKLAMQREISEAYRGDNAAAAHAAFATEPRHKHLVTHERVQER
jgi:hypothetical protein